MMGTIQSTLIIKIRLHR